MKKFVVPALAIAALAGSAFGQGMTTNQVQLQLRLVSQTGTLGTQINSFDAAQHPDNTSGLGVARRFEVQWRLVDLDVNDLFAPVGLTSGNLRIVATGGTLTRATLSKNESGSPSTGTPPVTTPVNLLPDTSPVAQNGAQGLHRPLRGGVPAPAPNNTNPANGILEPSEAAATTIRGVTPLSLSASGQYVPDDAGGGWFGLYSFNFLPTAGSGMVTVSFDADATSGNRFGFHIDGDPVPVTSPNATGDSATIAVPAPGAFALLGLGGLVAGRRRRA